ncbi:hypothetical protein GCM10011583_05450 [Streptomyces camponoticapitis]|uniref:DUF2255 family protein n=1 Tax=Streptomyces camponoticapitis TaxID=1616125 RepID=A0ABQ2DX98_9ACTN|nr:DUF2255 family protein [Streptomyces camponoticapitis]GGJ77058.1 hypothetical protein GCM10011583_05450 [Streptomyces camponoticapitis]
MTATEEFQETTAYLEHVETAMIATTLPRGGEIITPIWAVTVDGVPYIRSGHGTQAKWYRRALQAGRADFVDGTRRFPVRLAATADAARDTAVDQAYIDKYQTLWPGPTRSMTTEPARTTTLRLLSPDPGPAR